MIRAVKLKNTTGADVLVGTRIVPARGSLRISFREYIDIVRVSDIHELGLEVEVRDINFKDVSVKDFGARGDGFTDDTYAIQSAINYVADMGGGIVRVPVGVYLVSNITIYGDISLEGESRTDSIFKAEASVEDAVLSIEGANANLSKLRLVV